MLKRNSKLLNPKKTSHWQLEAQRSEALDQVLRAGEFGVHCRKWLADVEEAIQRRAVDHIAWLQKLADGCRKKSVNAEASACHFERRIAEIQAIRTQSTKEVSNAK